VLDDAGYNSLKVFCWIGSRSSDYERNFDNIMKELQEAMDELTGVRMRVHIEF